MTIYIFGESTIENEHWPEDLSVRHEEDKLMLRYYHEKNIMMAAGKAEDQLSIFVDALNREKL